MAVNRNQQMKEITERLEQGVAELFTSERYTEYLQTMSQFHNYSFNNTLLIAMQKPEATLVAGFQAWQKKFERHVKRGEKGIQIIAPAPIKEKEEVEKIDPVTREPVLKENGQPETEVMEIVIPRFRITTVFDVSQTEGKPLPELGVEELEAAVDNYEIFMEAIRNVSPVPIRFDEIEGESHGYYHNVEKEIVIQSGMSESQTLKTAIHEVAHAKLHDRELMQELGVEKDRLTREVEAESIAYTVCQYFHLDTAEYSFPYITGWSSGREMKELRTSMDTIRKTAGEFVDDMTEQLKELQADIQSELQEEYTMDRTAILPTDVIVKISGSMGSEYSVDRISNLSQDEVRSLLQEMAQQETKNWDGNVQEYLESKGAKVQPLIASNGFGDDYPAFFDLEYDFDTNGVTDSTLLSPIQQAENLINREEFHQTIFSDDDRNLIVNYMYQFGKMEDTKELVEALKEAMESPDIRAVYQVRQAAQAEIDALHEVMETEYQEVTFFETPALFTNGRIDEKSLPDGIFRYELRGSDFDSGYPIAVEGDVLVNHAGTILSAVPLHLPEQGYYWLGEGLDFSGGMATLENYQQEMSGVDLDAAKEQMEKAVGFANEGMLLSGKENRYAIYQIDSEGKGREYSFMSLDFTKENGMTVEGADYQLIYSGLRLENTTLDGLYERFNLHHPADYRGHSLSVSDVVLLSGNGEVKANYVDSFGFEELPEFVQERGIVAEQSLAEYMREVRGITEMGQTVTAGTVGLEVEGHSGTWHTIEVRDVEGEAFYLMEHDTFGNGVADIIVNAEGTLIAQELEHGFDEEAMRTVAEYLSEKEAVEDNIVSAEEKTYPPVYKNNLEYATEHGAADTYLDSRKLNLDCKNAIEQAIHDNFDGLHLAHDAVAPVLDAYGAERIGFVLADTVQQLSWDGRFSRENKAWAESISIPANISRGMDLNQDYVVNSHPAVLDGFIHLFREIEQEKAQEVSETLQDDIPMLEGNEAAFEVGNRYLMIHETDEGYDYTLYGKDYLEIDGGVYDNPDITIGEALKEILSDEGYTFADCTKMDYEELDAKVEDAEGKHLKQQIQEQNFPDSIFAEYESMADKKEYEGIALKAGNRYLIVQPVKEGYDYVCYDEKLNEINAGTFGDPDDSIQNATREIIWQEKLQSERCSPISYSDIEKMILEHSKELLAVETRLTSEISKRETALNGQSRSDIEYLVLSYARSQLEEMGLEGEVKLLGARVYGSRTRDGLYSEDSDVDVVLSYTGDIKEDAFFNALHEHGMSVAGIPLDVNPISTEKTGTLAEFMERAEAYLDEKELEKSAVIDLAMKLDAFAKDVDHYDYMDNVNDREAAVQQLKEDLLAGGEKTDGIKAWLGEVEDVGEHEEVEARKLLAEIENFEKQYEKGRSAEVQEVPKQPEQEATISFYVAECMEFHVLGEYHDNLTLEEALKIYETIPKERMHGIKGVGFTLNDGSIYDGMEYELMIGDKVQMDALDLVPHYLESPLVQEAISEVEIYFAKKESLEETKEVPIELKPETMEKKAQSDEMKQPQKAEKKAPTGRKESVLQALRERQAKLKAQESGKAKSQPRKKGEQEL
ncbi:MAG: DUF3849 domain-containing protein [Clostridia bacterium]|nr:DUF3849 domain-containing protein [Clostridia bacterium]